MSEKKSLWDILLGSKDPEAESEIEEREESMPSESPNVAPRTHETWTHFSERVEQLLLAVNEIEEMVTAVKDISTKTELLALNASIEAARAGQAGKGFAVVADEVGRLSEKAQQSIESVDRACARLRKDSDNLRTMVQDLKKAG